MNEVDEAIRFPDCENTIRFKRRRLEGPSIDAITDDAKESKLENLPSNCLQHILSFITYEKVSEIRQVSREFNENCIKRLDKGQRELEKRLKREVERAERMVLFPTNVRSSYDMLRFLTDLQEAIGNCTEIYSFYTDYFVAGQLLDEANRLLTKFNSSTTVPYFNEHVCDQQKHHLLGTIVTLSERARIHFYTKILSQGYRDRFENEIARGWQIHAEFTTIEERYKKKVIKIKLLENRKQMLVFAEEMSGEILNLIVHLNENVLCLTQAANEINQELEQVERMDKDRSNCPFRGSICSFPRVITKETKIPVSSKRLINLGTLPPSCVQNIVSNLNCEKMAQLRIVCKSFNEACKKELSKKFEKLKQKLDFKIKYYTKQDTHHLDKTNYLLTTKMIDLRCILQLCKDKCFLGNNYYYFAAGKVLDEANDQYDEVTGLNVNLDDYAFDAFDDDDDAYFFYCDFFRCRPYYIFFPLMDLVYKAIVHFKFNIGPNYFPTIQRPIYVPDSLVAGEKIDFEKESHLSLEEIENLIEETDVKIKERNVRNRKLLNITSSLKKKVVVLNREVSEKINVLKDFELKFEIL